LAGWSCITWPQHGQLDGRCSVRTLHLPDRFIDQASPADMYADAGLTSGDIADAALQAMGIATLRMERSAKPPLDPARLCQEGNGAPIGAPFSISGFGWI
jgi:hypothetical protein